MSNEKVLAALFECIEIGKSYYFEGAYYRLNDYGEQHLWLTTGHSWYVR